MSFAIAAYFLYLILVAIINLAVFYHIKKYRYSKDASMIIAVVNFMFIGVVVISTFVLVGVL